MTGKKKHTQQSLRHRLGHRSYHARREKETERRGGTLQEDLLRLFSLHRCLFHDIVHWGLRFLGLFAFANRQFYNVRVHDHKVRLRRLPAAFDGFRILHLSDLHLDLEPKLISHLIERLEGAQYDIAVITGDFRNDIFGPHTECMRLLKELLGHIHRPIYIVLGNHDYLSMVKPMEDMGARVLLNEHVLIERDGAKLVLAGIDDPNIYRTHDLSRALRHAPQDACTVLLSHSPAIHREADEAGIDLVLAGHTHGGQICLPGGLIIFRNDLSPRRYLSGKWHHGETQGYTSTGTGGCGVPVRLFCPGEMVTHVLRIRKGVT